MKDKRTTYQIYGRKAYETPLTLLARVEVEPEQALNQVVLAEVRGAGMPVGTEEWVELVAMPDEAMIYLIKEEGKS